MALHSGEQFERGSLWSATCMRYIFLFFFFFACKANVTL